MITDINELSRPNTRKSKRIISAIKSIPPKSSKTYCNSSSAFKNNIEKMTKEDINKNFKTENNQNENKNIIGDINYRKNMNLYRHILTNSLSTESNLDWILDLRIKKETDNNIQNNRKIFCIEPTFYKKDMEKFNEKKSFVKKIKEPISNKENMQNINHIVNDRLGEKANIHQINFELNLRKYEKDGKIFQSNQENNNTKRNTNSEWKQIPFTPKSRLFSSYLIRKSENRDNNKPSRKNNEKNNENKNHKKNIENSHEESQLGKFYEKQNISMMDEYLGEHKGMKPYSEKYKVKNAAQIQHLLKGGTNTQAAFQSGLRDY